MDCGAATVTFILGPQVSDRPYPSLMTLTNLSAAPQVIPEVDQILEEEIIGNRWKELEGE